MRRDSLQQTVINLDRGRHLVLASAGCGKTDILAERVRRALDSGVNPSEMLCLTFTNRASRGMTARIRGILGPDHETDAEVFIGNTHRFCSRFLFDNKLISRSTAILDDDDILSVLKNFDGSLGADNINDEEFAELDFARRGRMTAILQLQHLMRQYRAGHPRNILVCNESDFADRDRTMRYFSPVQFKRLCEEFDMPVSIQSVLQIYDNIDSYIGRSGIRFSSGLLSLMQTARRYEQYKKTESVVDFDDLLLLTYDYARSHPDSIPRYSWIQIDEVQDLNRLQFAIIDAFTADRNVTVYLGDSQQAIFSFIGAKLDTMNFLAKRCGKNIHRLGTCYRSPRYLLDFFNDYANLRLDTPPEFLPAPFNHTGACHGDLVLHYATDNVSAPDAVVSCLEPFGDDEGERTAVIVNSNAAADAVSHRLTDAGITHFKISGTDVFSGKQTKLVLAHLNVIASDNDTAAWARLLVGTGMFRRYYAAREFASTLRGYAISPADFLLYPGSAYVLEFARHFKSGSVVIFDTETTGTDIYADDIVQIAATRYVDGHEDGTFNVILHTERPIPTMLGDIVNPLTKVYNTCPHTSRAEGLRSFIRFAEGSVLIGHNVMFDYNILINNCGRDLPETDVRSHFPTVFDTLKLTRRLRPGMHSYKLRDLIEALSLHGVNSHLADEDIVATHSLAEYCHTEICARRGRIEECLCHTSAEAEVLRRSYGALYLDALSRLYTRGAADSLPPLVAEMRHAYDFFRKARFIDRFRKFDIVCRFIATDVLHDDTSRSLYEQLEECLTDLNTYREADLCESRAIHDRIFVATVHKSKGLEFDNVVVYGAVDGIYPFFANSADPDAVREDARKLYVAMTRARRRLCLLAWNRQIVATRNGPWEISVRLSPFLTGLLPRHGFITRNQGASQDGVSHI